MSKYTSKTLNQVVELYRVGHSTRDIEELTGVNKQTVFEWVRDAGILRDKSTADRLQNGRRNDRPYDALQKEALRLYVDEGLSSPEVARRLCVSKSSVLRWLKQANLTRPHEIAQSFAERRKHCRQIKVRHAYYLRQNGWTRDEIALKMNVSISTVHCYLRDARKAFGAWPRDKEKRVVVQLRPRLSSCQIDELTRLIESGQDSKCLLFALRDTLQIALGMSEVDE